MRPSKTVSITAIVSAFAGISCKKPQVSDLPGTPPAPVASATVPSPAAALPSPESTPNPAMADSTATKAKLLTSWKDCVGNIFTPDPTKDPGGQGRELLGVGFLLKKSNAEKSFVRVDRFDIADVHDAMGSAIQDIEIKDNALTGTVQKNGSATRVEGNSWVGATFTGLIRCPANMDSEFQIKATIAHADQIPPPNSNAESTSDEHLVGVWRYDLQLQLPPPFGALSLFPAIGMKEPTTSLNHRSVSRARGQTSQSVWIAASTATQL